MTLDEGIKHCIEVAEYNEYLYKRGYAGGCNSHDCLERAEIHRQLAEWLTELKEAKRLLKLAVEDMNCGSCNANCRNCNYCGSCDYSERFKWIHTDEALKLIGNE